MSDFSSHKRKRIIFLVMFVIVSSIASNVDGQTDPLQKKMFTQKELISKALEKSIGLKNQSLEIKKDQLDKRKVLQAYFPNVSFNSIYTRLNSDIEFKIPPITLPAPLPPVGINLPALTLQERNIWKNDLTATMVLFTGLKVPLTYKALEHKQKADEEITLREKSNVIKETVDCYNKLAVIEQSLNVLDKSKKRLDEETIFATKAYKEGLISSYDLSKIDIAQQVIEARAIELNSNRSLVISKLSQLTSIDRALLFDLHPVLIPFVFSFTDFTVENRPEVKALFESINANDYKSKAALSGYLPTIYAFSKKELRTNDLSAFDPEWFVGVGLKWNIFDGLQNMRDYQKAKVEQEIAKNTYSNALELFNLNLERSLSDKEVAEQLIKVAEKKKITASKGLEIAVRQYQLGLGSITERLSAENDIQAAELEYIQAIYNQIQATLNLMEATGQLTEDNINN